MKKKKKFRFTSDGLFDLFNYAFLLILLLIIAYPLYYVLIASISDPYEVYAGKTFLLPSKVTFEGYARVFKEKSIATGYLNSIYYTVLGTVVSVALIITTGYCVSKKTLPFRRSIMLFYVFTMYFNGGLIPTYLVVKSLRLIDSLWCFILPNLMSVWNMLILRNFFYSIPDSLEESALLDGATPPTIFFRIIVPLSMPAIATIGLFYAVDQWNNWFDAAIWINDVQKYPLQMVLRKYVLMSSTYDLKFDLATGAKPPDMGIKSAIVVISTLPMLCIYPFIQKYFVKGVMIGSVKG